MRRSEEEQEVAREVGVMEIEGYVLGPQHLWGQVLRCQQPLLSHGLLPSLPIDQVEVAGNEHQMVCFGVPTTCGANFWGAHHFS